MKEPMEAVSFSLFQGAGVTAVVSARRGGVAAAPFHSLNMSFAVGDKAEAVRENRRRFLSYLNIPAEDLVCARQVHGAHIEVVSSADRGRGVGEFETALPDCDGLATDTAGLPLALLFADCTPLLFWDPHHRAVGVAHGGWRGTVGDIAGEMVRLMAQRFGTPPEDLLVGIGPAIGPCCFEVGAEVVDAFAHRFGPRDMEALVRRRSGGKYLLDLPEANRRLLLRAGVAPDHVEVCGLCTYCREDLFFSYRKAGGRTGRHMAVIMAREENPCPEWGRNGQNRV